MLAFVHNLLVPEGGSGHAEYASVALLCVALVNVAAALAVRRGWSHRVFEAGAGAGVALAAAVTLMVRGTYFPRQVVATALVVAWGARLSWFLYARGLPRPLNTAVRVAWGMLCAAPVVMCNTRQSERYDTTRVEVLAMLCGVLSIVCEHFADAQKAEWHRAHSGGRPGRGDVAPPVCASGWWGYSRHPNLFFELCFHWSVYVIVRPVEEPLVVLCPLALTALILCFPGGVLSQELERQRAYALYPSYSRYAELTPVLVPLPWAKRLLEAGSPRAGAVLCLDWVSAPVSTPVLPF